jgi:hypothetical protein
MHRSRAEGRVKLKVKIKSASNLRAADGNLFGSGSSDPYTVCKIQGRPFTQFKTNTILKTLSPVWDEDHWIDDCHPGDTLEFEVFDYDWKSADDPLGSASLSYEEFMYGYKDDALILDESGKKKEKGRATLSVEIDVVNHPEPSPDAIRCFVKMHSAKHLRPNDLTTGKSDPFCVAEVPGKSLSLVRSKVIFKSLNPSWEEEDELFGFQRGDDIKFTVYEYDKGNASEANCSILGQATLKSDQFFPDGVKHKELKLQFTKNYDSRLNVSLDVFVPAKPKEESPDPGLHVTEVDRWPVPFGLRSLETGYVHQLVAYTRIGRSKSKMEPPVDLLLNTPGCGDISRLHAVVKAWKVPDSDEWRLRLYAKHSVRNDGGPQGYGQGPGCGHAGGGTTIHAPGVDIIEDEEGNHVLTQVDERSVALHADHTTGVEILPGFIIRFGQSELWALDKVALFERSSVAAAATKMAKKMNAEDPNELRELRVPRVACLHALKSCKSWFDFVIIVLEWLGEPDEPPCAEFITLLDEVGCAIARHDAPTLDEQEAYEMPLIQKDINVGTTIRLKLCSDPDVLGPVLVYLDQKASRLDKMYSKKDIPDT